MRKPTFPARLPPDLRLDAITPAFPPTGAASADPEPDIPFTPVTFQRNRRSGWTEQRQRAFIAALARCGSVRAAARHVGLSVRGAYRLLDMAGADSFAAAWDQAMDIGRSRLQADALERAINGAFVPIYRKGRLVRVEYRRCDKLAIALLAGRDHVSLAHGGAVGRRNHRADLAAADAARAEAERQRQEQRARYSEELQQMIRRGEELLGARRLPRVRAL